MIEVKPLVQLNPDDLQRLATGYTSDARYRINKRESAGRFSLELELVSLSQPYHKRFDQMDAETLAYYEQLPAYGFSFGAYDSEQCVGIALAEPSRWNRSLWLRELHVLDTHRRRGIGKRLVDALTEKAQAAGLRTLVCETQNTNMPAIRFYRRVGCRIEGIDLSYYSNDDFPDGEIAIIMKKRIAS